MGEKLERVKKHFKDNSKLYLGIGIGVVVSAVGGAAFANTNTGKSTIKMIALGWKPVNNLVTVELERRGHPGYLVQWVETGDVFPSQNHAAEVLGINPATMSQHLNGKVPHIKGKTFARLGEATTESQRLHIV